MIIHTAEDEFVAHVFHCEPSAGALCKIVEAACKVSLVMYSVLLLLCIPICCYIRQNTVGHV